MGFRVIVSGFEGDSKWGSVGGSECVSGSI